MTGPGAPRPRGRHASPDDDSTGGVPATGGAPAPDRWSPSAAGAGWSGNAVRDDDTVGRALPPRPRRPEVEAGAARPIGPRRGSGVLDRYGDETGPVPGLEWRHRGGDADGPGGRGPGDDLPYSWASRAAGEREDRPQHPSAPLPPRPPGTWSRLAPRADLPDDAPTEAQPAMPAPRPSAPAGRPTGSSTRDDTDDEDRTEAHHLEPHGWEDETGGLEVIGAHVDDDARRRRWRRGREDRHDELHDDEPHDDELRDDDLQPLELHEDDDDIPLTGDDRRGRTRRRRSPVAIVVALLVFGGLVVGIVLGGQKLLGLFTSEDYTGQGTGVVEVRVNDGDTLSDIARTLVSSDVIASVGPFVDAAEAEPDATGIAAGVYRLRSHMSGAAALDLLLDPEARLVSKVTIPEGLTVAVTLQKLAEALNVPVAELQAASQDPALGLPPYANGSLEGFLFPATYEVEPGDKPVDVLRDMVARSTQALDALQIPVEQRLTVLTKASLVQAEASTTDDMAKVARVLENRLGSGMPLQLDTTVNYANGKTGITTTAEDRANPSPYNTYLHPGLPPGPIGNPGEDALRAVLAPAAGDWLYFVVVDPDTGDTRFAVSAEEHQQNVLLFQQWLREHPGG